MPFKKQERKMKKLGNRIFQFNKIADREMKKEAARRAKRLIEKDLQGADEEEKRPIKPDNGNRQGD